MDRVVTKFLELVGLGQRSQNAKVISDGLYLEIRDEDSLTAVLGYEVVTLTSILWSSFPLPETDLVRRFGDKIF